MLYILPTLVLIAQPVFLLERGRRGHTDGRTKSQMPPRPPYPQFGYRRRG